MQLTFSGINVAIPYRCGSSSSSLSSPLGLLVTPQQIAERKTLTEMENGPEKASETESEKQRQRRRGRERRQRVKMERYREIINLFSCHLFVGDILLNHIFIVPLSVHDCYIFE